MAVTIDTVKSDANEPPLLTRQTWSLVSRGHFTHWTWLVGYGVAIYWGASYFTEGVSYIMTNTNLKSLTSITFFAGALTLHRLTAN